MKNISLILCLLVVTGLNLYSQEITDYSPPHKWTQYLHVESGFIYPEGSIKENIAIRQNISSYFVNQPSNGQISSETSGFVFGVRWEYFFPKYKAGVSAGLRYTGYSSNISGYSSSSADFFYLRYSMLNSDTKFARVKSIDETNNYIGIPLEIRFVPIQFMGIELFAKAGADFSMINLKKNTRINFQDESMENHSNSVLNSIETNTNKFYSTFYGTVGCKIGNPDKPNYIVEVYLPSVFLTKNNFSLTDVDYFEGFKLSIQFPINK